MSEAHGALKPERQSEPAGAEQRGATVETASLAPSEAASDVGSPRPASPYRADLHIHSRFSDGLNTPDELCRLAERYAMDALALSDHDTLGGLTDMARAVAQVNAARASAGKPFLRFFPAVEVSTGEGGRTHLICYGASVGNPALAAFLERASQERRGRAEEMLHRLQRMGLPLPSNAERVLEHPTVGRAHLARLLVAGGAAGSVSEAFERYLNPECPAYAPHQTPNTRDAIPLLRGMGLVVVLAHPMRLALPPGELWKRLDQWRGEGLMGLEAYHPSASREQARELASYARRAGLLVTGGSDYHGELNARTRMGRLTPGWRDARRDVDALEDAVRLAAKRRLG